MNRQSPFYRYGAEFKTPTGTAWDAARNLRGAMWLRDNAKRPTGRIAIVISHGSEWEPLS